MGVDGRLPLKKTQDGLSFISTEQRLVIRPTVASYLIAVGLWLGIAVWPWLMLPDTGTILPLLLTLLPAAVFGGMILHCCARWLTFDRQRDAVLWFPRRLCKVTSIRTVRIVKKLRRGKRTLWVTCHVALDLSGGKRVRLPGVIAPAGARIIAAWLNVEFYEEPTPTAASKAAIVSQHLR